MGEKFWFRAFRRANKDTLQFLGFHSRKRLIVDAALFVFAVVVIRFIGGVAQMTAELLWIVAIIAAVVIFYVPTFIWNLIAAPSRMEQDAKKEHKEEVKTLSAELRESKQRLQCLEEERIPRITVNPYGGRRKWDWEHERLMWAELQVTNTSPSLSLTDVEVTVVKRIYVLEKQDAPGSYMLHDPHDWHPVSVYWSERTTPTGQIKLTVPPNVTRTALIAFSDDSNGPPAVFNAPVHRRPLLHMGGAKIEIEVSGPDSAPWHGEFYIECHPQYLTRGFPAKTAVYQTEATFEFIAWETWVAKRGEPNSLVVDREDSEIE